MNELLIDIAVKLIHQIEEIDGYIYNSQNTKVFESMISFIGDLLEFIKIIKDNEDLKQVFNVEEINKIFMELETAMKSNDFISISDILNYEIKPLLEVVDYNKKLQS